jgi:crotonobetainyl-CoA:carnitine CoA-transferase CaiB-like acyl-CoA transferase
MSGPLAGVHVPDLVWEVAHPQLGGIRLPGHPVHYSRSTVMPGLPPPALGEHTEELRADMLGPAQADGS